MAGLPAIGQAHKGCMTGKQPPDEDDEQENRWIATMEWSGLDFMASKRSEIVGLRRENRTVYRPVMRYPPGSFGQRLFDHVPMTATYYRGFRVGVSIHRLSHGGRIAAMGGRRIAALKASSHAIGAATGSRSKAPGKNKGQSFCWHLNGYSKGKFMSKQAIHSNDAPAAIGTYSQAIRADNTVYLSGQIGLDPHYGEMVEGIDAQVKCVLNNLKTVAGAAGGSLNDIVKITVFLTDLAHFPKVNEAMAQHFQQPYPARVAIGVSSLPRGALVEMDAIMHLGH